MELPPYTVQRTGQDEEIDDLRQRLEKQYQEQSEWKTKYVDRLMEILQ